MLSGKESLRWQADMGSSVCHTIVKGTKDTETFCHISTKVITLNKLIRVVGTVHKNTFF